MRFNHILRVMAFALMLSFSGPLQASTFTTVSIVVSGLATFATTAKVYYPQVRECVYGCCWAYHVGWDPSREMKLLMSAENLSYSQGDLTVKLFNALWAACEQSKIERAERGFRFLFEKAKPQGQKEPSLEGVYLVPYDNRRMDLRGALADIEAPDIATFLDNLLQRSFFTPELVESIRTLYYNEQLLFARVGNDTAFMLGWDIADTSNIQDSVLVFYFEKESTRGQVAKIFRNRVRTVVINGEAVDAPLPETRTVEYPRVYMPEPYAERQSYNPYERTSAAASAYVRDSGSPMREMTRRSRAVSSKMQGVNDGIRQAAIDSALREGVVSRADVDGELPLRPLEMQRIGTPPRAYEPYEYSPMAGDEVRELRRWDSMEVPVPVAPSKPFSPPESRVPSLVSDGYAAFPERAEPIETVRRVPVAPLPYTTEHSSGDYDGDGASSSALSSGSRSYSSARAASDYIDLSEL